MSGQDKIYQMITDQIINIMEKGEIPWRKPWHGGGFPKNLVSKKQYRGINAFLLQTRGFSSSYWLSFKQVQAKKGKVKKGEKGTPVIFWKWLEVEQRSKETGGVEKKRIPMLRYYTVFNLDQTEGIADPEEAVEPLEFCPIEEAERIIANMPNPPLMQNADPYAYYRPAVDLVNLPARHLFTGEEEYYSTAFHELGHSTGHASRLNRPGIADLVAFGSADYSREELVAEFCAAYLCGTSGIAPAVIENAAAYIKGWSRKLRENPRWLIIAAAQAQKAADYILGRQAQESEGEE